MVSKDAVGIATRTTSAAFQASCFVLKNEQFSLREALAVLVIAVLPARAFIGQVVIVTKVATALQALVKALIGFLILLGQFFVQAVTVTVE
jgi:hypothetical protein